MGKKGWLLILCMVFTIGLSGCSGSLGEKKECKELIWHFEQACNELDIKEILNDIDPKVSNPIKAVVAIGGMLTDNMDEYFKEIMLGIGKELTDTVGGDDSAEAVLASIHFQPEKYALRKKEGTVRCIAVFGANGMDITKTVDIAVMKKNDTWYISGICIVE